jgi:hypothetical protein
LSIFLTRQPELLFTRFFLNRSGAHDTPQKKVSQESCQIATNAIAGDSPLFPNTNEQSFGRDALGLTILDEICQGAAWSAGSGKLDIECKMPL